MVKIGKRHLELATKWIPSATIYGAFSSSALLYFTDWKAVLQYMPFYNGQFKPREY
ncbi:GSCOCG00010582001-RA-CDS [Cotesia congregata]|nr:GSCOCG00010582001-RA-CDS [Cotesia congregata]